MSKFWDLLSKSIITQSVITLLVMGVVLYLVVTSQPVPDWVQGLAGVIVGFFFGSKVGFSQALSDANNQKPK